MAEQSESLESLSTYAWKDRRLRIVLHLDGVLFAYPFIEIIGIFRVF